MDQNELMHHGIRGQKWGVRRYQNADGSLTSAGKKRYLTEENFNKVQEAKANAKYAKAKAKADARTQAQIDKINEKTNRAASKGKDPEKAKIKAMKDMSNEELQAVTARMNMEMNYLNAKRNLANASPKEVNKGVEFLKEIGNDVVKPVAKNLGKTYLEKMLKEKLGLDAKDATETLKKEVEVLELKKRKKDASDYLSGKGKENDDLKKRVEQKRLDKEERDLDTYERNREANEKSADLQRKSKDSTSAKVYAQNYDWFKENHPEVFRLSNPSDDVIYQGQTYVNQFLLEDKHR